jgi:YD repeat-containing protein
MPSTLAITLIGLFSLLSPHGTTQAQTQNTTTHYAYDANGNLTSSTDPLGNVIQYTYDALNRPISSIDLGCRNIRHSPY